MGIFNCIHPRYIVNDRGETHKVRCGRCEACTNMKGLSYTTQSKLESQSHKYNMFVTLTYADMHLPLVSMIQRNDVLFFVPTTKRLSKHVWKRRQSPFYAVSNVREFSSKSLSLYYDKFKLSFGKGFIPVLDKSDVQDFMKRLRYYLSKYTNEKIRYFACGEYGPVHFRPHYHLELWFDEAETLAYLGKAISEAWTFGRVDYSLSKGKTASYVANYVNSTSCRSRLHSIKAFSPFVLHSTYLFGSFYQNEVKKGFENEFAGLVERSFVDNGRIKQVSPLLAFEGKLFGRCINFNKKDTYHNYLCYTLYERATAIYGVRSVTELTSLILDDVDGEISLLIESLVFDGKFNENTIKSMLYTSKKFLKNCDLYKVSPHYALSRIEKYWSDKDYYNLTQQLYSQIEFLQQVELDDRIFLLFWYDNFEIEKFDISDENQKPAYPKPISDYMLSLGLEPNFVSGQTLKLSEHPLYAEFCSFHRKLSNDLVKHKKLNDLNKIFVYG